jgi:hypothetical protein
VITLLLRLLRLLPLLVGGHRQLALENLALRQQLAIYKRTLARPQLRTTDRLFWAGLTRIWTGWRQALVIVAPDTVLRWQRRRFREYWARLSRRPTGGRPPLDAEIAALIRKMAAADPLWGAPRIHGELLKLGVEISERTVCRIMPKRRFGPSQTWRTFLANHLLDLVSIDFFTVPTARCEEVRDRGLVGLEARDADERASDRSGPPRRSARARGAGRRDPPWCDVASHSGV